MLLFIYFSVFSQRSQCGEEQGAPDLAKVHLFRTEIPGDPLQDGQNLCWPEVEESLRTPLDQHTSKPPIC